MRSNAFRLLVALCALWTGVATAQTTKSTLLSNITTTFPDNTTGTITPASTRTFLTSLVNSFQQYTSVNLQNGASYTIAVGDYGKLVSFSNAAPIAVTIPEATGSFLPFNVLLTNTGAGLVTVTPSAGTINGGSSTTVPTNASLWIIADGSGTNWAIASAGSNTGFTGSGLNVLQTSPTLITPTLGVAKATTLEATDGSACTDHAAGAQIFVCRNETLGAGTNSHAFSTSDVITISSNGDATNAYDDETNVAGAANPNHHQGFQFLASYTGSGTMTNLVGFASSPGLVASITGTITNLIHYSATSPSVGGGGSVGTQYAFACAAALTGATTNRCFFSSQSDWNELRGHIITGPFQPTLTTCGTNPAILGSDTAGEVTMGTGNPTACTISFDSTDYQAYVSKPLCTVSWQSNLAAMAYTVSASAITLTQTATSSNKVNYTCIAQAGG